MKKYVLYKDGNPVEEPDLIKWATWFEDADRHVADERVGKSQISTVFLGIDHSFEGVEPVLWETMVFGGPLDQECSRCAGSCKDAMAMHANTVRLVKEAA